MSAYTPQSGPATIQVPVFPLPSTVLFPNVLLPLHIFEPRYRQMVTEAVADVGLIAIALQRRPWDEQGEGYPDDVYSIGSLGEIVSCDELPDGNFDIVLRGLSRYRLVEFQRRDPYRMARVQLLRDPVPPPDEVTELSDRLIQTFRALRTLIPTESEPDLDEGTDFPTLVNSICSWVRISEMDQQHLLEVDDVGTRGKIVLKGLNHLLSRQRMVERFRRVQPEDPSVN